MRFNRRLIFFLFLITIVTLCWYLFVKNSVNLSLEALTVAPFNETVSGTKPWSLVDREVIATPPLQRRKRKYSTEKLMHLDRTRPSERSKDAWLEPMMLYKDAEEKFQEGPACLIPKINPFHELAMKELHDVGVIDCPKEDFGHVVNGSLILKAEGLRYAHIQYIQRPAVIDNVDDNYDDEYLLSDPFHLIEPNRGIIQPGNIGCLVAYKSRILKFEDDFSVVSSSTCTPDAFFEIRHDGLIQKLDGKFLTIKDCSLERCLLVLRNLVLGSEEKDPPTRFSFDRKGQIKHVNSSMCLVFATDQFDNFDELILSHNCRHPASWWTMYNFPENDVIIEKHLTGDFVKLLVMQQLITHIEYHAVVTSSISSEEENLTLERNDFFNVALIMLESQSAANIQRKMPRGLSYLESMQNSFIFKGHTIVGDGTTDQLCAILVGRLEKDLPDASRSAPNSVFIDDWPLLLNDFRSKGYVTLFSEDDIRFSAFNYRLNGFKNPPSDHYARVFWLCANREVGNSPLCIGKRPYHKVSLDYTESFFDAYVNRPKVSVTILSAESHNNVNNIQYIEGDFINFLRNMENKGHLRNTFIFILGDHGLRASVLRLSYAGWLEERLPFFALVVPDAYLRGEFSRRSAIHANTQHLTSHFDIYATLRDILYSKNHSSHSSAVGENLLKRINYKTRTCKSAGIEQRWCPCQSFYKPRKVDARHEDIARAVVNHINKLIANVTDKYRCAKLVLKDVKHVFLTKMTDLESNDREFHQTDYMIVLSVLPSGGIYEASVTQQNSGDLIVSPVISRLDLYGDQPICIVKDHPNLRKFCYCTKLS